MYRSKKEVTASIKKRRIVKNGIEYPLFVAFFGTDPVTKKKVRVSRSTMEEIKSYISDFYSRLSSGGESAVSLTPYQATDARNAYDLLAQNGISKTLVDCVRMIISGEAIANNATGDKELGITISEYLESISIRSKQYIACMKHHLNRLALDVGSSKKIGDISTSAIKDHLTRTYYRKNDEKSWTTYNDALGAFKTFFNWCCSPEQGILGTSPVSFMKRLEVGYRQPEYVKASNAERLIRVVEKHKNECPEDLADVILSFMCGMRSAEIARVREGESAVKISIEERFIRVIKCKGSARGIKPRAFHIPEQALAWMKSFDFISAVRKPNRLFRKHLKERAKEAKIHLPKNAGRHTFITMYEAVHHDSNALSAIVGNTESVRSKCYNGVELEKEGRYFFAILPLISQSGTQTEPHPPAAQEDQSEPCLAPAQDSLVS